MFSTTKLSILLVLVAMFATIQGFGVKVSTSIGSLRSRSRIAMEYIPDGLTKAQWEAMKKKEAEEVKNKDFGKIGITKFKSRSFESWQKSGQRHLFPVDPSTPLAEKPYMQRMGGSADGADLKAKGIQGKGQGAAIARVAADDKYEKLEKEGKLKSTPFVVPWTQKDVAKIDAAKIEERKKEIEAAKKKNAAGIKPQPAAKASAATPSTPPPAKKGFFGLF